MNPSGAQDSNYDPARTMNGNASGDGSNPELDRILAELAGYTASNNTQAQGQVQQASHSSYTPQQVAPTAPSLIASTTPSNERRTTQSPAAATARPQYAPTPPQPSTPQVDPSTILEWPAALRCVNKISASNTSFGPRIKEMMADQDRNVRQWWEDRNNLINTQKTKNEGRRSLNAVLKGVGGKIEAETTPEQDKAELDRFDMKVYNASQQMTKHHEVEMKRLGVPFFGVDPKYIIANSLQQTTAARNALSQATITEKELRDLQKKMIQYLEDMYKD